MHAYPRWKVWLILAVLVASVMGTLPNITSVPSWWPSSLSKPMNLGLDLKGGIHLVLEVDVDEAVNHQVSESVNEIRSTFRSNKIRYSQLTGGGTQMSVQLKDVADAVAAESLLKDRFPNFDLLRNNDVFTLTIKESEAKEIKKFAVDQTIEVVRSRIDQVGTKEPVIVKQGERRVLVQMPGAKDSGYIKSLLGQTALLEFKLVDEKGDLDKALEGNLPAGSIIVYGKEETRDGKIYRQPYLLKKHTELSGAEVTDARVSINANEYAVNLKFNAKGARTFDKLTAEHVNERFAIILDGKVQSAPNINERISGGSAQITGRFTALEARDLAIVLRAGALPAPISIVEERSIGPSLGQDSINQGIHSIIIGAILVLIFMAVYYRLFGMVANIALAFNLLLIVALMSMIGATLTLPGIAGIVLTIGMAVDANVLIFERIREEVQNGKTPLASIDSGFDKAFLTIVDANITTLIAAIVLFQFGTGPVKGFAVTLSVGILASMFTAIMVTRAIIALSTENRGRIEKLSI
ncbi:MAG: protein translocase subunit SecD [Zetaproteobacteria bacterium CG_4_9_14_3_um_filter_49_83]|nr:MAG: protein-export membrane protein SecD [Zetaproteobacteria bacterium CG1_02_49_23]PIQ31556.1 MAG: protein translocase subunit SecD [Zetaproteobacteria bacterium CG17_big_fil_post_rev_8_21_14_2_50_50_13]PIV31579.1 MAG: protein translocase subunit SecD [Zetaproteobacteria bacterium CG02_land_8_20_14_3_00_50_9]PIY54564.1 MAG: protein translocase subunit SecD [Zetaproteobacteria bacterium CG_4_10_14_0_8_um_filter_49_80]PJA35707.1 MAG: protein translocase subunit SecD [Zetaproteobacteria bacte